MARRGDTNGDVRALLNQARTNLGLETDQELANSLGLNRRTLERWAAGGMPARQRQRLEDIANGVERPRIIVRQEQVRTPMDQRLAAIENELAELRTAIHAVLLSSLAGDSQKLRELLEEAARSPVPPPAPSAAPPSKRAARRRH